MDEVAKEMLPDFIEYANECIYSLESILIPCEAGKCSIDAYKEVLRIVHGLKGTAGSFGFEEITDGCHEFETASMNYDDFLKNVTKLIAIIDDFQSRLNGL